MRKSVNGGLAVGLADAEKRRVGAEWAVAWAEGVVEAMRDGGVHQGGGEAVGVIEALIDLEVTRAEERVMRLVVEEAAEVRKRIAEFAMGICVNTILVVAALLAIWAMSRGVAA